MRKIRTFMDYLLYKEWEGEHINRSTKPYLTIYGKIIYPVAVTPIAEWGIHKKWDYYQIFKSRSRYPILQKGKGLDQ